MRMRAPALIPAVLAAGLALASCAPAETPDATPTAAPTSDPSPTATPAADEPFALPADCTGLLPAERWLAGTVAGVSFAKAFTSRGRLSDAVLTHAVANAALAGYVLVNRQWQLW